MPETQPTAELLPRPGSQGTYSLRPAYVEQALTMMVNSVFNGWRMEDVWLDK
jgi:hypothetical protein